MRGKAHASIYWGHAPALAAHGRELTHQGTAGISGPPPERSSRSPTLLPCSTLRVSPPRSGHIDARDLRPRAYHMPRPGLTGGDGP